MKQLLKIFIFLLFTTLFGFTTEAKTITLEQNTTDISLLEHSELFIDIGAKRSYSDIQKNTPFVKADTDFLSRGYTSNEAIWVRFTLKNDSDQPIERMIHIDNSMLDSITLYPPDGTAHNVGALNRPAFDGIIDFYFPITLPPHTDETYHLRVLSNSCANYFHLYAETHVVLWQKNLKRSLILVAFLSLMMTLIIYNSFIYAFTREKVYLYYVLFMFMISYNHFFSYTGMLLPMFYFLHISDAFLKWWTAIDAYLGIYYFLLIEVFFILFFTELVQTKRFPILHRTFQGIIALLFLITLTSVISGMYLLDLIVNTAIPIFILAFCTILYLAYKKEENALYLLIGLGANAIGHIFFLLYNFGTYIPQGGYWYFYEMSLATEGLLFSIVLSKKLSHTKALTTALNTQQILIRELHHRVKNNLQFIVSLYRLKLRPFLDSSGRKKLTEAEGNIHSIGKIHEILYAHQNISELNASEYLNDLIGEIKRGYPSSEVTIHIHSDVSLAVDQAIYCGLIVNELVTNALKYAFEESHGEIIISLEENEGEMSMSIRDNGKGFVWEKHRESFGLSLIERLIKDELHGRMEFSGENGSSYRIIWS
jgi:two-component sensor histidine kinase